MREPTATETAIFDALTEVARPVILTAFRPDSCIASTRIALDVLDYFGVRAREMAVTIFVFNAEAAALLGSGMTLDEIGTETRKHTVEAPGGPWTIGIGAPTGRTDGWAGHLVVAHRETGVLIDLSADQAARPHKGIDLDPYWLRLPDEDWWTDPERSAPVSREDGVVLLLSRRVSDPAGYQRTANWRRRGAGSGPGVYRTLTGEIIRLVRHRLDG